MLRTNVYHFVSFCEDVIAHHSLACRVEANNDHAQQKQHYQKLARLHKNVGMHYVTSVGGWAGPWDNAPKNLG